jgi:aminoglycoside 6'-N-acetyltransferase
VILRPLEPRDAEDLRRIRRTPEVERWWFPLEDDFPFEDDEDLTRLTIEVDGSVAGLIQYSEDFDPLYRHASIDLFVDPAFHNRGIGTAAIRQVVDMLVSERGHHRITIDPAAGNVAAIHVYEKAGFRPVGVMHAYERDADGSGWHDGLLMELVIGP